MFKNIKLLVILLSLFIIVLEHGCRDIATVEAKDVKNQEPYKSYIGAKYALNVDCYLAEAGKGELKHLLIIPCDMTNSIPENLNLRIVRILPKDLEFTVNEIKIMQIHDNIRVKLVETYVKITANNVIARAYFISAERPSKLSLFNPKYARELSPRPVLK